VLLDHVQLVESLDVLENARSFFGFDLRGDQRVEEAYPNLHLFHVGFLLLFVLLEVFYQNVE
jgi:hypothetical protein